MTIENHEMLPFYKALIENTQDVVTLTDTSGIIQYESPSIKALFGYEPDELVGSLVFDKVHPEDKERSLDVLQSLLSGEEIPAFIVRFQHKDGSWRYIEAIARLLESDVSGILLTSRDVTAHEETKTARRLVDASFEAAFHAGSTMNSITVVETGEFLSVNAGWQQIMGWSREEAIGSTALELNVWGSEAQRSEILAEVEKNNGLRGRRVELTTKHGETRVVLLDATFLMLPVGKRLYFSGIDITEREQTEEKLRQSQRLDAIGHLTGGIAHDFNNLLSVIMGHADLAAIDLEDTAQLKESLAAIERASVTGANLIQKLLSFSRKQSLQPSPVKLGEHLDAMRPLLKTTLEKDIELNIDCVNDNWHCLIDPLQFDSAVLNMTINARDAMADGGTLRFVVDTKVISPLVSERYDLPAGEYVELQIKDTGVGMSEDAIRHAFDPFFTTKQDIGGSGLGLSMVFGFITQSGGRVYIEPAFVGTTITILLPRAVTPAVPELASDPETPTSRRNDKALLVEDNEDVRILVVRLLELMGYDVTEATTVGEAEALIDSNFDLMICDLMLPGNRKGPEVGNQFQRHHPNLAVLYMSGYQQGILTAEETESEKVSFIQKPFTKAEFSQKIDDLLKEANAPTF